MSRDLNKMCHKRKWGQSIPGRENYKGKDPELGSDLTQFMVLEISWLMCGELTGRYKSGMEADTG